MSRPPRFFITPEQLNGTTITLAGEDVRHIGLALRMKTGERISLADGSGNVYLSRITKIDRSEVLAEVEETSRREPVRPAITLVQGLPKSDKMDWIVQKTTELGVANIVPVITGRTIVKVKDEEKRLDRWRRISREAAMQSDRIDVPVVEPIRKFNEVISSFDPRALCLIPWEEASAPIRNILQVHQSAERVIVLIGPEGGFSEAEAAAAKSSGAHPVSLGSTILRTETAAIAAVSMIRYAYSS